MLLLIASGLLLRSFAKMLETDPGFQPQHVLTASLSLPRHDYPTQQKVDAFYAELQRKIEAMPGVQLVGFSSNIPIVGQNGGRLITPQGHVRSAGEGFLIASTYLVQGNYFQALAPQPDDGTNFTLKLDQLINVKQKISARWIRVGDTQSSSGYRPDVVNTMVLTQHNAAVNYDYTIAPWILSPQTSRGSS